MKQKNKILILIIAVVVALTGFGGTVYVNAKDKSVFPSHTTINGVDCSKLTTLQAERKITKAYNHKIFEIKEGESTEKISELGLQFDLQEELKTAMQIANMKQFFVSEDTSINQKIDLGEVSISKKMMGIIKALKLNKSDVVKTTDAYIDLESEDFKIIPEVYGKNIDLEKLALAIIDNICQDNWSLDFVAKDYYVQPSVTKDDSKLLERQEYCKKYLTQKITYDLGNETYVIPAKELDKMISLKDDSTVGVNNKNIKKFVKKLAQKCDTLGKARQFKSTSRGTILVSGGTYGYSLNQSAERKALKKNILAGKDITRKPKYSCEGANGPSDDIGNTYIEVDLGMQHFWYYKNGSLVVDDDVVSGCVETKHATPSGVYYIQYMTRDAKLKGRNDDGTKYESEVAYWMPFYYDYGLHDASWRGDFGGSIYISGGSHGCVNLPIPAAKTLYENTYVGCPVVVFY